MEEVIKIMTMGSTSVERCDGKDFVAMRMIAPKITKTLREHQIFEDMMPWRMSVSRQWKKVL